METSKLLNSYDSNNMHCNALLWIVIYHKIKGVHHVTVPISKCTSSNPCPIQLLADERCRWLTHRSYLMHLIRKKEKKKKLKSNKRFYTHYSSFIFIILLQCNLKPTRPVIDNSIDNKFPFSERCNDCNVIKQFKKRRKCSV